MIDAVPALLAGNAVVAKPSEIGPYSAFFAFDLLYQAGVPEDVAQIVTGDGVVGAALVGQVDYICFTGSTAVGRKVAQQAAGRLIPYSLELGGKDAMVVLADARLDIAAAFVFIGGCENAGQACASVERVYVEEAVYEPFIEQVRQQATRLKIGPGDGFDVHVGSMTNEREILRTEAHIRDAVEKGAEVIFGGQRRPDLGPLFFEPTVLVNVDHSMRLMQEETFGPLIPIMRVKDADDAVRLANDSVYGLSGTIFTRDLKHGEKLALRINSGDVVVNRVNATIGSPHLPWGGQKDSGVGRRGGPEGLIRFVSQQSILLDRQIGAKPNLNVIDPLTHQLLVILRVIRRFLPLV
jgi:succinate-semialdehyde dehydrogenase/glutarate-semialdehyde dehydrogenase